jgi:hypothetical protein
MIQSGLRDATEVDWLIRPLPGLAREVAGDDRTPGSAVQSSSGFAFGGGGVMALRSSTTCMAACRSLLHCFESSSLLV